MNKDIRRFASLLYLAVFFSCPLTSGQSSAQDANFRYGVAAYNSGDFKTASQYFNLEAKSSARSPGCLLYLGHSLIRLGRIKEGVAAYNALTDEFHNSKEARMAARCIIQYDPALAKVLGAREKAAHQKTQSSTAGSSNSSNSSNSNTISGAGTTKNKLIERITICPPKQGHPEVSKTTIDTVKSCIERLPPQIAKILNDGDATITISTCSNDLWPNSGEGVQYGTPFVFGEMMGRTYGKGAAIFERSIIRGSSAVGPPRGISEIRNGTYKELGHALDGCLGECSKDPVFLATATFEAKLLSGPFKRDLAYLTQPSELFAQIAGELMGAEEIIGSSCPDSKAWIKSKLRF